MTAPVSSATWEDRDRYPLHEEDDMPEKPRHERQNGYLRSALRAHFPGWFITGNVCIYWEPDNYADYAAPDVLVVRDWQPVEELSVFLTWADPPVVFVAEIFSSSQPASHQSQKEKEYASLVRAREYFSYHQDRGELRLRRLGPRGFVEVPPEPNGRVRSEELHLEFGLDDDGFLWAYTLDGERLMTHEEEKLRRQEAEARAAEEAEQRAGEASRRQEAEADVAREAQRRQEAEADVAQEAQRRQEAEARAAQEARQRQEVEARAEEEERQRHAAEKRAAEETARREELERQLAALRAQLEHRDA